MIANIDGTNAADITVEVSVDNGSNYVKIANTISVPADATLVVVGKDNGFLFRRDRSTRCYSFC